ncbi:MAG: hypothetical protein MUO40_12110 [Anaerolineaceae bacterium]|nr:hypothetical protein [Anaerolineaceae bacterium]
MIKRAVIENGLVADLFTEDSARARKAIIMLGGSEGGKSWSRIKKPIEILVQRGYSVLSLAYFKAQNLPSSLEDIPLEYFEKAFFWLSDQRAIIPGEFAILGGSKGAEAALLLGSRYPQVKAVVALSPSCVVWQGIPKKRFELGKGHTSSWSYNKESLPFTPYPLAINKADILLLRLRKVHEEALQNKALVKEGTIRVEDTQGAILLISGKKDHMWPATYMSERIVNRLTDQRFIHHYEHIEYNSGHNGIIMNKNCWRSIFDFLEKHFG